MAKDRTREPVNELELVEAFYRLEVRHRRQMVLILANLYVRMHAAMGDTEIKEATEAVRDGRAIASMH